MKEQELNGIKNLLEKRISDINTCIPGTIVSIKGEVATIRLSNKRIFSGVEQTQADLLEVPLLSSQTPGFAITLPIKKYLPVPCLVIFSQRSLDNKIGVEGEFLTEDNRMHDLSDAMVIPAFSWSPISNYNENNLEIRSLKSDAKIEMSDDGQFKITNGDVDLLDVVSRTLNLVANLQILVKSGSSGGIWDLEPSSKANLESLKNELDDIIL